MAKMTKRELLGIVNNEIGATRDITDLETARETALEYYLGEPFGNEQKGRSAVVSTDVQETIEWIMPSLMRIFTSTDRAVEFEPVDKEDDEGARQESDIVNHAFYKENNGFLVLYSFFKDALMQKNGIVKFWWDDSEEKCREEYEGLSDPELMMLLDDANVEPVEHTEEDSLNNVVVIRTNSTGRVQVEPVPPEEFLISNDATSIDPSKARFVCHSTLKTRSELIAMGFSKKIVKELPTGSVDDSPEALARDNLNQNYETSSTSMDRVRLDECYIKIDFDGDGLAELRQVSIAGNKILVNEEVDAIPFAAITPIILTHKFYGLSVADTVMDLQLIKSTLLRGILDSTYHANNPRTAGQDGMVNLDDLLTNRPGGHVRTLGPPGNVLTQLQTSPLPQQTFQVWTELETIRKSRTGVGQDTQGLDGNVLAHARTGVVSQSFDMARMRIELIARVFAETGVKDIFLGIHRLTQQNQNKKRWIKVRGEWIEVDPNEWKTRQNMTSTVGLGTGNKDRQIQGIAQIIELQKQLSESGRVVSPQNLYNSLEELVAVAGFKDVSRFFTDPSTLPPPEPPPPTTEEKLAEAQVQLAAEQVKTTRAEAETNRQEAVWRHEEKMKDIQVNAQIEFQKLTELDARERTEMELKYAQNVPGSDV